MSEPAEVPLRAAPGAAVATPLLVHVGARWLVAPGARRPADVVTAVAVGTGSAVVGVLAAQRAGSWWWLPALLVWATALVAVSICDARAQRIPTWLIRRAGVVSAALLILAALLADDVRGLALSFTACVAAALVLAACWRFLGAGFGDVRLAALGGLGLGHATFAALAVGVLAFATALTTQAGITSLRRHDRSSTFGYGPALALGFLVAAMG